MNFLSGQKQQGRVSLPAVTLVVVALLGGCGANNGGTGSANNNGGMGGMNHGGTGSMGTMNNCATSGMNNGGTGGMNNCGTIRTTDPNAPFELQFIDMMVPHHMGAVEMAKIAQQRAEHPELKTLANGIIASQNTEIGQMKEWRKAWFGSDATPPMDNMPMLPGMSDASMMTMTHMMQDMDGLKTAKPFDKAFLMAMIPHHESAIEAAKIAQQKATRPEIKTLAGTIITEQQREIDQMRGWMTAWYGK